MKVLKQASRMTPQALAKRRSLNLRRNPNLNPKLNLNQNKERPACRFP
jgi:hypothetical protein